MKKVGEFLNAGLEFVTGDICKDEKSTIYVAGSWSEYVNKGDDDWIDDIVIEFAWRENTGIKPEFSGLIEVELKDGTVMRPKKSSEFMWALKLSGFPENRSIVKWRPSLNQPSVVEPVTKESAIHKAWVALSGKVKAISEQWKTLWHVKDGYYINGEYYHSFNDKCEEAGAKFICTKREFTDYCEKMAAEEKRMDIIGQNGNDGLHYDNAAQQVEALAVNRPSEKMKFALDEVDEISAKVINDKPIFTQAMAENGDLPPVGCKVKVCIEEAGFELEGNDAKHECKDVTVKSSFTNKDGDKIVAIENDYGNCACYIIECIKPLDTRTPKQKAVDAAFLSVNVDKLTLEVIYDLWRVGEKC